MTNYTAEEMELKIKEFKGEIIKVYDEKPERKELQEFDILILSVLIDKLESAIIIKYLIQSK